MLDFAIERHLTGKIEIWLKSDVLKGIKNSIKRMMTFQEFNDRSSLA
jgi:hypothetical protein